MEGAGGRTVGGDGGVMGRRLEDQRLDALNAEEELEKSFVRELEREKEKERRGGKPGKKKFVGAMKVGFVDCGVSTTSNFFFFFFFQRASSFHPSSFFLITLFSYSHFWLLCC